MSKKINQKNSGKKFWMVWNPATGYTHQKHYSMSDAVSEAKRLACVNLGKKFVVLEGVCEINPVPVVKVNMLDEVVFDVDTYVSQTF